MSATLVETDVFRSPASTWPPYPVVYEINTWIWLWELSQKYGRKIDLSTVPDTEWESLAKFGFDALWLMGIWERSPIGIAIANKNPGLLDDFQKALPDFQTADNVGSPYCVRRYEAGKDLGGREGLETARRALAKRGMKLVLDFVPNHVAPDHPWVTEHPEYFMRSHADDAARDPSSFIGMRGESYACGRDPYFPAWPDVLQLNAFQPNLRMAAIETLNSIADQCDGVRCDMAMLFMNAVFERTWGNRAGPRPAAEYWSDAISAVKRKHPSVLFIAEAYWDLEWELQQLGFDFCYDKKLYDRMACHSAEEIRLHLCADLDYQKKLLRFIENHDEPRAASKFSSAKECASAFAIATLPGTKLFHQGQFEGCKVRLPVFMGRRPDEPLDERLVHFYTQLLEATNRPIFREGQWTLCTRTGWPDNPSFQNLLAWSWQKDREQFLCVINFSDRAAQGRVQIPWPKVAEHKVQLTDYFSGNTYERDGSELISPGLYVALEPWSFHFFRGTL
jgi:glycosidase